MKAQIGNCAFMLFYSLSGVWLEQIFFTYQAVDVTLALCLCPVAIFFTAAFLINNEKKYGFIAIILITIGIWCYQSLMVLYVAGCAGCALMLPFLDNNKRLQKNVIWRMILLCITIIILYLIVDNSVRLFVFHTPKGNHVESHINLRYGKMELYKLGYSIAILFFRHFPFFTAAMDKIILGSDAIGSTSLETSHVQFNNPYYAVSSLLFFPGFIYLIYLLKKMKRCLFAWFLSGVMVLTMFIFTAIGGGHCPVNAQFSIPFVTAYIIWYDLRYIPHKYIFGAGVLVFLSAYFFVQRSSLINTSDLLRMREDEKIADMLVNKVNEYSCDKDLKLLIIKKEWVNPYKLKNYQEGEVIGHSVFFHSSNHYGRLFINLVEGTNFETVTDDSVKKELFDESKSMPAYPNSGCIKIFGDTIVMKLTEGGSADELY